MIEPRRRAGGRAPSSAGRRAPCTASRTAARAATPTWSRPSRGCRTARRSRPSTTSPAHARPSLIGTLEASGLMKEMTERLADDAELAAALPRRARRLPRRPRPRSATVPEIDGVSAGGMPDRVKCLHVLVGHALAAGPGVNPLGDEALERLGAWWSPAPAWPPTVVEPVERAATASKPPIAAVDCGTNTIKLLIGVDCREAARARVDGGAARPGRRPHRPARRRGAGAHLRGDRRATPHCAASTASSGSGSAPPRPPATPPTPRSSATAWSDGSACGPRC